VAVTLCLKNFDSFETDSEGGLASPKAGLPRRRRACLAEGGLDSPKAGKFKNSVYILFCF
ncbi:MAG: hypothetical protein WBQ38_09050, partial [Ignavibacteria bacterium]